MTWRETASRRLNHFTGGHPDQLFCARVYFNAHVHGSFWIPLNRILDAMFRDDNQHCRMCWIWEMRNGYAVYP